MEQPEVDAGIDLFICIPIHGSDPPFLSESYFTGYEHVQVAAYNALERVCATQQTDKGEEGFASVKQAHAEISMTRAFDHHAYFLNARNGRLIDRSARCSDEVSSDVKHSRVVSLPSSPLSLLSSSSSSSSSSSPSPSSPSSSSSISDLFRIEEHEPVEFVDERIKPRFRFLADLY